MEEKKWDVYPERIIFSPWLLCLQTVTIERKAELVTRNYAVRRANKRIEM